MEKLVDDGLVKHIGISNFSCMKIDDLLSYARIEPAVLQVEVHPYFRNQQVVDHCKTKASFQHWLAGGINQAFLHRVSTDCPACL